MSRFDMSELEWRFIVPILPNKVRGVPRVDDRRVINAFSTSCAQVLLGVTYRSVTVLTQLFIIALIVGQKPACGTA